jgi:serine/threonine-protein phosphatase PGAM5
MTIVQRMIKPRCSVAAAAAAAFVATTTSYYVSSTEGLENGKKWDYNWDRLQPAETTTLSSSTTTTTRVIFLIRHGQFNQKGKGDAKHDLTDLGKRQALLCGKRLRDVIPEGVLPTRIISSTMTRAEETASIIRNEYFKEVDVIEKSDLIREGGPCRPEPDTWTAYGGPSESEYFKDSARIEAGFRWLFHRPKAIATNDNKKDGDEKNKKELKEEPTTTHEIVVCHGNVIRYSLLRLLQLPPEAWLRFSLYNGSITRVELRSDGLVSVRCVSDAGFMDPVTELTFN